MVDTKKYEADFLADMLQKMLLIRRFEEKAAQMYGVRKIGGFCHLYNGQEAVAVGTIAALDLSKDYTLTSYRDHAHALTHGIHPNRIMAELFGKIDGCSRGKGGSMHMFDVGKHMFGGNGIVASQIPVAAGVAFACQYRKDGGVVLCYFGDGAIHQGAFHEIMNMAAVWKLPLILLVENNQYGMGTSVERISRVNDFEIKAKSYGISGRTVNGMSVIEVFEATRKAVLSARRGAPRLIDVKTYRYRGHSMSDPGKYRTKKEVEQFKNQDPILILKGDMIKAKILTEKDYTRFDNEAKQIAQEAVDFAEASPEPGLETMYEDIYA